MKKIVYMLFVTAVLLMCCKSKGENRGNKEAAEANLLKNSSFSLEETGAVNIEGVKNSSYWTGNFNSEGQAVFENESGILHVGSITGKGLNNYSIQLIQSPVIIDEGGIYKISFKARAAGVSREIAVKVGGTAERSWKDYSKGDKNGVTFSLDEEMKVYEFTFVMDSKTDPGARFEFQLGLSTTDVWIDEVKLIKTGQNPVSANKAGENENQFGELTMDKGSSDKYKIKALSYNIEGWKNHSPHTQAEAINATGAQVIGLQEGMQDWQIGSQGTMPTDYSRTDNIVASLNQQGGQWTNRYQIIINAGSCEFVDSGRFDMTDGPNAVRTGEWAIIREKSRGDRFLMVNLHWDHQGANDTNRAETMEWISTFEKGKNLPVVIVGDFNRDAGETGLESAGFQLAKHGGIDGILTRGMKSVGSGSITAPSDHTPIFAALDF